MYQATRIEGVRSHFVVNTASTVFSMRERPVVPLSRFNNRDGTLSRVPELKINYIRARAIRNSSTLTSDKLLAGNMNQQMISQRTVARLTIELKTE